MKKNYIPLYDGKTIKKISTSVTLNEKQKKAAKEWLNLIKDKELQAEENNYFKFGGWILEDILGYPIREFKHEDGNVEFPFSDKNGTPIIHFEVKGMKDSIFDTQDRKEEHRTPIKQAWDYLGKLGSKFAVVTNYRDFYLFNNGGYGKGHLFNFEDIEDNEDKLKEFIALFSWESVQKGVHEVLAHETDTAEKKLSDTFYKLFHETRLLLIDEFTETGKLELNDAIHHAQLFLNRLIFVLFAENNHKLPKQILSRRIHNMLESASLTSRDNFIYSTVSSLFESLDQGEDDPEKLFGFNGGLFKEKIPPEINFKDYVSNSNNLKNIEKMELSPKSIRLLTRHESKINPIIPNILSMAHNDFEDENNIKIFGHILEQSLSDLDEIKGQEVSKRKTEGVFYTPDFVTDYICRHTIVPYLSKTGTYDIEELVHEYSGNLDELETKFVNLKILDPACGSGAFLLKAVEILLKIQKQIQKTKKSLGAYGQGQVTLDEWNEESEARKIISNNVYGIDINEEAVEISKLSIFLKIITGEEKLINLSKNIIAGNSIKGNKTSGYGDQEFDIIIGNPPYIPTELLSEEDREYFANHYEGLYGKYDTSIIFVEKYLNLLKKDGFLAFILPTTWQTGDNYETFRKLIFTKFKVSLSQLVNLPYTVFPDAYVDTGITIFKNQKAEFYSGYEYEKNKKIHHIDNNSSEKISLEKIKSDSTCKALTNSVGYDFGKPCTTDEEYLGDITRSRQGIVTTQHSISDSKLSEKHLPFCKVNAHRYYWKADKDQFIDSSSFPSYLDLYTQPKIMIERIVNRQNRLNAFYDDTNKISNKNNQPFILTDKNYDLFYILGLLNSKYFAFAYNSVSELAKKDNMRQTTLAQLRKFKIKKTDTDNERSQISSLAKSLSKNMLNFRSQRNEFLDLIIDNFKIKPNTRLIFFYHLTFSVFRQVIEELSGKEMSLKEQKEWKTEFNQNHKVLNLKRNQITSEDNQIDKLVYSLYEINSVQQKSINEKILDHPYF